jgi:Fur family iron response transcriptional regulator
MNQNAPAAALTEAQAAEKLRKHDILPTQQRLQIAQVLLTHDQHVSAERVLEMANAGGYSVSKATVYNTLGLFAEKGIVREVIVDPARVFYDTNSSLHHHFYNVDSGELSDIDTGSLPVEHLPPAPPGTVLEGVDIVIRVRNAGLPVT